MDEAERCHRLAFIFRGETLAVGTPNEVVDQREMSIAEIEVDRAVAAADAVRTLQGVEEVSHYGHIIRVALRGPGTTETSLRQRLESGGFPVLRYAMVRPTVEDAFVSMVREDELHRKATA